MYWVARCASEIFNVNLKSRVAMGQGARADRSGLHIGAEANCLWLNCGPRAKSSQFGILGCSIYAKKAMYE